jgi:predicted Rossmann-fold nucleotide-binding protein
MPGGFGTLDELTESITLIQTHKLARFPIVLVGKQYWAGLIEWLKGIVLETGNISPGDLEVFKVTDTAEETVKLINEFYNKFALKPNF